MNYAVEELLQEIALKDRMIEELERQLARTKSYISWQTNPDRSGGYTPPEEVEMYKRGGYGW